MVDDNEYKTSDQLLTKALIALHVFPKKCEPENGTNRLIYVFDLSGEIENNKKTFRVNALIDKIRLGDMSDLVITLQDMWVSENIWTMNVRHRDVLSYKG
jgi:hypothetical protein